MANCNHCGALLQTDATFCGQCGTQSPFESFLEEVAQGEVMPPPPPISPPMEAAQSSVAPTISSMLPDLPEEAAMIPPPPPQLEQSNSESPPTLLPKETRNYALTQLQVQTASLIHIQTQTQMELPQGVGVIHLGKPNEQIPPDIDVSGFPHADVVSRIHADIRVEGETFYIEDVGSSNGTYINHTALPPGNRHRLRHGDRISLGKGDLVTFIFQLS